MVREHRLDLADAGLVQTLLVLGGVVVAVLLEVAEFSGPLDQLRDVAPCRAGALGQFVGEPLVGLGGKPRRTVHEGKPYCQPGGPFPRQSRIAILFL